MELVKFENISGVILEELDKGVFKILSDSFEELIIMEEKFKRITTPTTTEKTFFENLIYYYFLNKKTNIELKETLSQLEKLQLKKNSTNLEIQELIKEYNNENMEKVTKVSLKHLLQANGFHEYQYEIVIVPTNQQIHFKFKHEITDFNSVKDYFELTFSKEADNEQKIADLKSKLKWNFSKFSKEKFNADKCEIKLTNSPQFSSVVYHDFSDDGFSLYNEFSITVVIENNPQLNFKEELKKELIELFSYVSSNKC